MNIEDLKCCGNCKHRRAVDMGDYTEEQCGLQKDLFGIQSYRICINWKFDKLKFDARIMPV